MAERGGRNRSETLEAPFVGRQDELRLLKELFHATGREGRSRLVSVIGPAGIGKTRLAWEFLKYVDGLLEGIWWHEGRCPAYGEGISFWALGEMVRQRCELLESDDEPTTREKVARYRAPVRAGRRRTALDPAGPAGPPRPGGARRVGAALRRLADILRAARRGEPGGDGVRGLPPRGQRARRLRRPPDGVEPERPDLRHDARPPGAPGQAPGLGSRQAELHERLPGAPVRARDARPARRARAGPARRSRPVHRRPGRRHPALRGGDRAHARGGGPAHAP